MWLSHVFGRDPDRHGNGPCLQQRTGSVLGVPRLEAVGLGKLQGNHGEGDMYVIGQGHTFGFLHLVRSQKLVKLEELLVKSCLGMKQVTLMPAKTSALLLKSLKYTSSPRKNQLSLPSSFSSLILFLLSQPSKPGRKK